MKKIIVLLIVSTIFIGIYLYVNKSHTIITNQKTAFNLSANDLIIEFNNDSEIAQKKYLNKIISINGKVTNNNKNSITLNNVIFATKDSLFSSEENLKNSIVILKGRFIGFDDLLEEIKLDQSIIINNQ